MATLYKDLIEGVSGTIDAQGFSGARTVMVTGLTAANASLKIKESFDSLGVAIGEETSVSSIERTSSSSEETSGSSFERTSGSSEETSGSSELTSESSEETSYSSMQRTSESSSEKSSESSETLESSESSFVSSTSSSEVSSLSSESSTLSSDRSSTSSSFVSSSSSSEESSSSSSDPVLPAGYYWVDENWYIDTDCTSVLSPIGNQYYYFSDTSYLNYCFTWDSSTDFGSGTGSGLIVRLDYISGPH